MLYDSTAIMIVVKSLLQSIYMIALIFVVDTDIDH